MKKKKTVSPEKEMSFLDHLEELRWHLNPVHIGSSDIGGFGLYF